MPTGMVCPVEADEAYFGGKRANMPLRKRRQMIGRGRARPRHGSGLGPRDRH